MRFVFCFCVFLSAFGKKEGTEYSCTYFGGPRYLWQVDNRFLTCFSGGAYEEIFGLGTTCCTPEVKKHAYSI